KVPFHVIAVITEDSLGHASEIFRHFEDIGIQQVGFNVEELEGGHTSSSLKETLQAQVEAFWQELYDVCQSSRSGIQIREFQRATQAILTGPVNQHWRRTAQNNDQVLPFRIISVDWAGGLSTFSPELLGVCNLNFANFTFGQVGRSNLT